MKKIKKILSVMLLVVMISMVSFASNVFAAEKVTTEVDAAPYIKTVYEKMLTLKNYHADIAINIKTDLVNVAVNNSSDIEVKPMQYKSELQFTMTDVTNRSTSSKMTQYMEQGDNQLITYSEMDGKWSKQTFPYVDKKNSATYGMKLIKKAVVTNENDNEKIIQVTMDNKVLKEMTVDILKQSGKEYKEYTAFIETIFSALGDINYIINVDKNTNTVTHLHIDLSEATQKSVLAMINQSTIPEKSKTQLKDMFSNATVVLDCDYSNFNQVSPIEIPQEVKESVVEQTANSSVVPTNI